MTTGGTEETESTDHALDLLSTRRLKSSMGRTTHRERTVLAVRRPRHSSSSSSIVIVTTSCRRASLLKLLIEFLNQLNGCARVLSSPPIAGGRQRQQGRSQDWN